MAPIYEDLTSPPSSPELQQTMPTAMSSRVNINFSDVEAIEDISERFITLQSPQSEIVIGRGSPADIDIAPREHNLFFASKVVSRIHAHVTADHISKHIFIQDQKSMHGTFVGGKRLGTEKVELHPHDIITFGQQVVRGADTFEPLRLAIDFEWFQKDLTEKAKVQPSAQASRNTFTFEYSDVDEDEAELTDEEPKIVGTKRVSPVIEIEDDELPKAAASSVETSPQSKKSDDLIDSPSTSTSSIVQAADKNTAKPGFTLDFSSVNATQLLKDFEQAEGQDDLTDADDNRRGSSHYTESEEEDAEDIDYTDDEEGEEGEAQHLSQLVETAVPSKSTLPSSSLGQTTAGSTSSVSQVPYQAGAPSATSWRRGPLTRMTEPDYQPTRAYAYAMNATPPMNNGWQSFPQTRPQANGMMANPVPHMFPNHRPHSPSDVALPVPNLAANYTNFAQPPPLPTMTRSSMYATAAAPLQAYDTYTQPELDDLSYHHFGQAQSQQGMLPGGQYQSSRDQKSGYFNNAANNYPRGFVPTVPRRTLRPLASGDEFIEVSYDSESDVMSDTDLSNTLGSPKRPNSTKRKFDDSVVGERIIHNDNTEAHGIEVKLAASSDGINDESEHVELENQSTATSTQVKSVIPQVEEPRQSSAPIAAVAVSEVVRVESTELELPPRKKARIHPPSKSYQRSYGKQLVKNTAMVLTGAAIGAVGTVFTLASLPADYFV